VGGYRHDRAGPVGHEHVIGDEDRDPFPVDGVESVGADEEPRFFLAEVGPFLGRLLLGKDDVIVHGFLLVGGRERRDQRMFRRQDHERGPEQRVGPGGEDADRRRALHVGVRRDGEIHLGPFGPADPVLLHGQHFRRPSLFERRMSVQELLGVGGDLEEPLGQVLLGDLAVAPPAMAVLGLFVGQHRLARRTPVHGGFLPVGQPFSEHLQEDPLVPTVIVGVAGGDLGAPIVGDAQPLEHLAHVGDVGVGPVLGTGAVFDGRVLRRQAEGVPPHGMHDVMPVHALVTHQHVGDGVVPHVAHVEVSRRIREHHQTVVGLVGSGTVRRVGGVILLPAGLPLSIDVLEVDDLGHSAFLCLKMEKIFDVPLGPFQRGDGFVPEREPPFLQPVLDVRQDGLPDRRVPDHPFDRIVRSRLELRFDEHDPFRGMGHQGGHVRQHLFQGDEGHVDGDDVGRPRRHLVRGDLQHVRFLEHRHARIVPEFPVDLPVSHVQGHHVPGPVLKQAIREAARGGADVEARPSLDGHFEIGQGAFEFLPSPRRVTQRFRDGDLFVGLHEVARFGVRMALSEDAPGQEQRLGLGPRVREPVLDHEHVEPDLPGSGGQGGRHAVATRCLWNSWTFEAIWAGVSPTFS